MMEVGIAKFEKVVFPVLLSKQFCCAQHNWVTFSQPHWDA